MSKKTIKKKQKLKNHPFELAFCGYRNTGKTTLMARLTELLAPDFKVAYLKHDAHHFEMDHAGKDTEVLSRSGAIQVMITAAHKKAVLGFEGVDLLECQRSFEACDLLLIEGYKQEATPKIIVLDSELTILERVASGEIQNVLAYVGQTQNGPTAGLSQEAKIPYFQRDDIAGILALIREYFQTLTQEIPLYGLVLAGGRSRRMEQDKALLCYQDKTQVEVAYDLLSEHCVKRFVSSRQEQWQDSVTVKNLPQIHDRFLGFGPMGGILTAMTEHPEAAWLVLACDLPLLDVSTLEYLRQNRNPYKLATAFQSASDGLPEPLCAIYEPRMRPRLLAFLGAGYACPRKVLLNSEVKMLNLPQVRALDNANYPTDYLSLKEHLQEKNHV